MKQQQGKGILTDVGGVAADALYHHGIPWLAKKTVEMGRYGASELMRNKDLQKKAVNYVMKKLSPFIQNTVGSAMDELSTKVRPNEKYKTDPPELDGKGVDIHKWKGKLPRPKAGWTPGKYKYMGAYNPLDEQLEYDPETGEVLKWKVLPYNKVGEISAYHDICYDMGKNKGECDREMIKSLDQIPYGEMPKWGSTARFLINTKQKLGLGVNSKKRKSALSSDWSQQLAEELHKPITKNFRKRKVISKGIDKIWAADLVEMQKYSKWNKGVKYLLMVIDVFSKYGWIKPLKDKKTESVSLAFDTLFKKSKRKPDKLWTDKGSEFNSKHFLKKNNIKLYHTENEEKSSVVERWNRTMKNRMWKMFSANNNTVYWDKLDQLVDNYNNTKHSRIKMTPIEASKKGNEKKVLRNLYGDLIYLKPEKPKCSVGDKVRISKYKRKVFDKGYTPNWTEEIFVIHDILLTNPLTYKVVDLLGEEIEGSFYEKELQKAKQQTFRI